MESGEKDEEKISEGIEATKDVTQNTTTKPQLQ
jgi:hypothetical protein